MSQVEIQRKYQPLSHDFGVALVKAMGFSLGEGVSDIVIHIPANGFVTATITKVLREPVGELDWSSVIAPDMEVKE